MTKLTVKKRDEEDDKKSSALSTDFASGLMSLRNMIDNFFDDSFMRPFDFFGDNTIRQSSLSQWIPPADISETEKEIRIKMNTPDVDPEKINIEVEGNTLIVSGSTETEKEEKEEQWYRSERAYGEFRRMFQLPYGADTDNISAKSRFGTIKITIPKKEDGERKKIAVDQQ